MKKFSDFINEEKSQFTYEDMTTKNFDICPAALAAFKQNVKDGDFEGSDFRDAVEAVDKYLGIEKQLVEKGAATESDFEKMKDAVEKAKDEIEEAGLSGHDYHQRHLDAVKDLMD